MTLTLLRASDAPDGAGRADLVDRFAACAAALRPPAYAPHAPSPEYTRVVLGLARTRPSELLLVTDGERVVARALVAASAARDQPDAAVLGLFETALGGPQEEATRLLVEAARAWTLAAGRATLFAPVDVLTWLTYRFLAEAHGSGAGATLHQWEPVQPPEYPALFLGLGFEEAERYQTVGGYFRGLDDPAARGALQYTGDAHRAAVADGYTFTRLESGDALEPLLAELYPLCMHTFSEGLLFEPIPRELFVGMYAAAARGRDCSLTHWVRDPEGRLVGFVFAFVDGDAVVIKTIAVAPDTRGRRLSTALGHLVMAAGMARGHLHFVSALVRRGNTSQQLAGPYVAAMDVWRHEYVLLRAECAPR